MRNPADLLTSVDRANATTLESVQNKQKFPRIGPSQWLRTKWSPGANAPVNRDEEGLPVEKKEYLELPEEE